MTLERGGGRTVALIASNASLVSPFFIAGHAPAIGSYMESSISWKVVRSADPIFGPAQDYRVRLRPDPANSSYPEVVSDAFSIVVETATDAPGSQIVIKKGDCIISSFLVVARPHDPTHVTIMVQVQNLRYSSSAGLQLHLIKNHLEFKFLRIPEMKSRTRWHTAAWSTTPRRRSRHQTTLRSSAPATRAPSPTRCSIARRPSSRRAGALDRALGPRASHLVSSRTPSCPEGQDGTKTEAASSPDGLRGGIPTTFHPPYRVAATGRRSPCGGILFGSLRLALAPCYAASQLESVVFAFRCVFGVGAVHRLPAGASGV